MLDAQKLAIITCFLFFIFFIVCKILGLQLARDRSGIAKNERLHLLSSCEKEVVKGRSYWM